MPVAINNLTVTFADSTQPLTALGMNVKYVAAGGSSKLLDLKIDGQSKFFVDLDGYPSSAISTTDQIARNYGLGANVQAGYANTTARSSFDRANAVNITAGAAFDKANVGSGSELYIANTYLSTETKRTTVNIKTLNFNSDFVNTGIRVAISEQASRNTANIVISTKEIILDNVQISSLETLYTSPDRWVYEINNSVINKPYKQLEAYIHRLGTPNSSQTWMVTISTDNWSFGGWTLFISYPQSSGNLTSGYIKLTRANTNSPYERTFIRSFSQSNTNAGVYGDWAYYNNWDMAIPGDGSIKGPVNYIHLSNSNRNGRINQGMITLVGTL